MTSDEGLRQALERRHKQKRARQHRTGVSSRVMPDNEGLGDMDGKCLIAECNYKSGECVVVFLSRCRIMSVV